MTLGRENEGLSLGPGRRGPRRDPYRHAYRVLLCEGGSPPKDGTSTQRRGACAEEDELPCLPRWSVEPSFVAPKPPQTLALGIRSSCWLGSKE